MISVTPQPPSREDRAGDPLDGLVNLFDLGIVLAVAFLLAALSSLHLGGTLTKHGLHATQRHADHDQARTDGRAAAQAAARKTIGRGVQAGVVYRLANGQLVYVQRAPAPTPASDGLPLDPAAPGGAADRARGPLHLERHLGDAPAGARLDRLRDRSSACRSALTLGLGRFRGRRALQVLANASMALPPVVVGVFVLMLLLPRGRARFAADRVHAPRRLHRADAARAAVHRRADAGRDPGAARRLLAPGAGARRRPVRSSRCWRCARRRSGSSPAVIAAVGSTVSEVGAV